MLKTLKNQERLKYSNVTSKERNKEIAEMCKGKQMKKRKSSILISLITVMLVFCCTGCGKKTPEVDQLKNDFISKELDNEEYSLTCIEIETELKGENDFYKAIVSVVYNDGNVEYSERYHFTYNKYDEWILDEIEDYENETWSKKPLTPPTVEEFKNKCISKLDDCNQFTGYDQFEAVTDKTEVNLEEGQAEFVFDVEYKSVVQKVSGEIEFSIKFDYDREKWYVDSYSYADSYSFEHNIPKSWSGKGSHLGEHGAEIIEKDFSFELTSYEIGQGAVWQDEYQMSGKVDGQGTGVLTYEGIQYLVEGNFFAAEEVGDSYYIDMCNVDKKIRIDGYFYADGKMDVTVDTAYKLGAMFYRPVDRYGVNMVIVD